MIIQINATVCARLETMVRTGRQKIAGSDKHRRVQKREGRAGDQEEHEVSGTRQKRWFFRR